MFFVCCSVLRRNIEDKFYAKVSDIHCMGQTHPIPFAAMKVSDKSGAARGSEGLFEQF